jgi:hypothetical protein
VRTQTLRHLALEPSPLERSKPPELSWHDYLIMLLHIGAEIEHGLMVEYLYAAYSLGGDQVPARHRPKVQRWRDAILTVAVEEMGHLLCVQNLLCLLGGPVNLDREDYPWDTPYYPFPFRLEPISLRALSCYVFAEMPLDTPKGKAAARRYREFQREDRAKILRTVRRYSRRDQPHRVGEIYETVLELISDETRIPDACFDASTYDVQASWDEWGRGHRPPPRSLDPEGSLEGAPQPQRGGGVIIERMATRSQAVAAIMAISGQGEAPHLGSGELDEPSHFDRFLEIYQGFERIEGWEPARDVPVNPTTIHPRVGRAEGTYIESERSREWAHLFNVRYRMLLSYLSHTFRLARVTSPTEPNVRAAVVHRVFGEMYNLKTIASILMRLPLRDGGRRRSGEPRWAGPPFEMPYSLRLPAADADCWRLHQDLLASAGHLGDRLLPGATPDGERYLRTLRQLDAESLVWLETILAGAGAGGRAAV